MRVIKNITILDDDNDYLNEMKELLVENNVKEIKTFSNPEKFLDLQESLQSGLFILDLDLKSRISGFMVLAEIRRRNPEVPIFIISGYITEYEKIYLSRSGATKIFNKPFEIEKFQKSLTEV